METYYDTSIRSFSNDYSDDPANLDIVPLHEDILKLTATLLSDVKLTGEELTRKARAFWKEIYGYEFVVTQRNRMFVHKNGLMMNIDDKERNVAFKAETFLGLLQGIQSGLDNGFGFQKSLYAAGTQCGTNFGDALRILWKIPEDDEDAVDVAKLSDWCDFDSRTGFGEMSYKEGIITVKNAFIIDETDSDNWNRFADFFNGYVEGVLKKLGYKMKISSEDNSNESHYLKYEVLM
jgi:hypothetical protein